MLKPGDKVVVKVSDLAPFAAIVRAVHPPHVYIEGSSIPYFVGSVTKA